MTPAPVIELPSKSQITKAGKLLKRTFHPKWGEDGSPIPCGATYEEIEAALQVLTRFRAAHAYPMQKIRYGVRSFIRTEGAQEVIAQRLKRVPRIIRKLDRMPNCPLPNLEDIGGCRAVLADGPELERVRARLTRAWRSSFVRDPRDYIQSPKPTGYRAVHFVIQRDGRYIEVQLRTVGQQQWADAVENADSRLSLNLKDGSGPPEMIEYFSLAGEVIFLREYGRSIDPSTLERFNAARKAVIEAGHYTR